MDRKLTIGLVTPAWPGFETPNGIATAVYHLVPGLRAAGHRPVIIALAEDAPHPDDTPVIALIQRPWSIYQKIAARLGRRADVMADAIGDNIADAVDTAHAAYGLDAVIMEETQGWAHRIALRGRVPVILELHGPWLLHEAVNGDGSVKNQRRADREARAFASAKGILAPARNVLEAVEEAVNLGQKNRAFIPYAFRAGVFTPRATEGPILFVGRFDRHKGGDTVLDAFARVHAARPDAQLTFAGPDRGVRQEDGTVLSMEAALSALPPAAQAAITAPGRQSAQQVAAMRRIHPIAIMASRYEVVGYTVLEAMAVGQAIVSTDVGGPAEILEHEKTALLVPPDDPRAMANALLRLMDDPDLARRLSENAAAELRRRFAPEVVGRQVAEFVAGCLETSA